MRRDARMTDLPVIDVSSLKDDIDPQRIAGEIGAACRDAGRFYAVGHGVPTAPSERLEQLSREFFAQPLDEKQRIRRDFGGRASRGYFPVGDELTSGIPDDKGQRRPLFRRRARRS